MAESSRLVGGGSWKFDPYKIFREICFVANCRTSYTLRINLIFSIKGSLNSQIPRKISVENSNLERVDFQNFLYPNLSNESNNQSSSINAKKPQPLLALSAYCKKGLLIAKRYSFWQEKDRLNARLVIRNCSLACESLVYGLCLFQHLSLKDLFYQNLDNT